MSIFTGSLSVIYCPWYRFSCGYKCISNHRLCDGYADCYDGRDEMAEHCSSSVSPTSTGKNFKLKKILSSCFNMVCSSIHVDLVTLLLTFK